MHLNYGRFSDIVLNCSSCTETTKILCGQLNIRLQLADVSFRCSSHADHLVETLASCKPNVKLSSENLCCFHTGDLMFM